MVRVGSFSSTTTAFVCASCRAVLTQKSRRRRASLARTAPYRRRVLPRFGRALGGPGKSALQPQHPTLLTCCAEHLIQQVPGTGGHRHHHTRSTPTALATAVSS